eukprot:COSAG01_NODE_143_length_24153_cov_54.226116_30_plen_77_part_00
MPPPPPLLLLLLLLLPDLSARSSCAIKSSLSPTSSAPSHRVVVRPLCNQLRAYVLYSLRAIVVVAQYVTINGDYRS